MEEPGLFLYFPRRALKATKLRAFIDAARERLSRGVRCQSALKFRLIGLLARHW
jgi:hypothetical protein